MIRRTLFSMRLLAAAVICGSIFTAAQAGTIAYWDNTKLNKPGPIPATFGSATLSRGPSLVYRDESSVFSSTNYSTSTLISGAIDENTYAEISVDASLFTMMRLYISCGRRSTNLGPKAMQVYISSNGPAGP